MVRCGVELIGLDRIGPADPRLAALVWSWAPDEPSDAGRCARWGDDARFRAADCAAACTGSPAAPPPAAGPCRPGRARSPTRSRCATDAGATFDVPRTGWEDEQLRVVARSAGAAALWLNLGDTAAAGWQPALASAAELAGPTTEAPGREIPVTGGSSATLPWAALVLTALLLARNTRPLGREIRARTRGV